MHREWGVVAFVQHLTSRGAQSAASHPRDCRRAKATRVCGDRCSSRVVEKNGNMKSLSESMSMSVCKDQRTKIKDLSGCEGQEGLGINKQRVHVYLDQVT